MKLNGCNISFPQFSEETIEEGTIIFIEDQYKIIVLNSTAATIWRYILESYRDNIDISYNDIVGVLKESFHISAPNQDELLYDVDDTVSQFFQNAMIVKELNVIEEQ